MAAFYYMSISNMSYSEVFAFIITTSFSQRIGLLRDDGGIDTLFDLHGSTGLYFCQGKCYQFVYIEIQDPQFIHFDSITWKFSGANPSATNATNPYICFPDELIRDTIIIYEHVFDTRIQRFVVRTEELYRIYTEKCPPEANFESDRNVICQGNSIQFVDSSQALPEYWAWSFEGGIPSAWIGKDPPPIVYPNPGLFEVNLYVSNSSGEDSLLKTQFISVFDGPSIQNVTRHYKLNFAEEINLKPCAIGTEYNWYPSEGLSCTDCPNPILTSLRSTDYRLIVSLDDGMCSDTCYYSLEVNPPEERIWFPTAFSPNADGINDLFIGFEHNTKLIELRIYNRWGGEMFVTNDGTTGWNGDFNGQPMEPGVYVYFALFEKLYSGKIEGVSGEVTLRR